MFICPSSSPLFFTFARTYFAKSRLSESHVHPPLQKYSHFPFYPTHLRISRRLVPQRGGSRSSRTRGGMRWTRAHQARKRDRRAGDKPVSDQTARRRMMRPADGEVVWS